MKLNLASLRTAAAGLMSIGVLAGIGAVAGPASAASWTHLCSDAGSPHECLYASGPSGAELVAPTTPGLTNWTYPALNQPATSIKQANVNLCLQLHWNGTENPTVVGASCVNDQAEMWKNVYDSKTARTLFESVWTVSNGHGTWCLVGAPGFSQSGLFAQPCTSGVLLPGYGWGTS